MLQVGIGGDQFLSAEHITASLRLPDNFQSHQVAGGGGTEDSQGLSQFLSRGGSFQLGSCSGSHQQGHHDELICGIGIAHNIRCAAQVLAGNIAGELGIKFASLVD